MQIIVVTTIDTHVTAATRYTQPILRAHVPCQEQRQSLPSSSVSNQAVCAIKFQTRINRLLPNLPYICCSQLTVKLLEPPMCAATPPNQALLDTSPYSCTDFPLDSNTSHGTSSTNAVGLHICIYIHVTHMTNIYSGAVQHLYVHTRHLDPCVPHNVAGPG